VAHARQLADEPHDLEEQSRSIAADPGGVEAATRRDVLTREPRRDHLDAVGEILWTESADVVEYGCVVEVASSNILSQDVPASRIDVSVRDGATHISQSEGKPPDAAEEVERVQLRTHLSTSSEKMNGVIDQHATKLDGYFDMIHRVSTEERTRVCEFVLIDALCWAMQCGVPRGEIRELDRRLYDGFYRAVELNRKIPHPYAKFVEDRLKLFDSYKFRRS